MIIYDHAQGVGLALPLEEQALQVMNTSLVSSYESQKVAHCSVRKICSLDFQDLSYLTFPHGAFLSWLCFAKKALSQSSISPTAFVFEANPFAYCLRR